MYPRLPWNFVISQAGLKFVVLFPPPKCWAYGFRIQNLFSEENKANSNETVNRVPGLFKHGTYLLAMLGRKPPPAAYRPLAGCTP